ncbi:MAG: 2-phosphosulfolactate phosphatase family protein [Symploca sp. SIO1A3]|nr:2-phosphosulfolactate phosphatase family protein [Symploca sp. SIO2C1]NER51187.1 2-phosphosulfolactate phosphatase family protein [Symploca sp. SIO1A3]
MKLFVYHTPELTPTTHVPDCAIVIDVLRATTTIATALDAGAEAVQAFSNIEQLLQVSEQWPSDKRLRAGERGGAQVAGCDMGNSPLDCTPEKVKGRRLFISTTNGTRALQRVQEAPLVLATALVNRQATVQYLLAQQPETIWLVGSGWEGTYSLEDTVCAGAIAYSLVEQTSYSEEELSGNDEVVGALSLYHRWQNQLLEMFHQASHGKRLLRLDGHADLKYCAQTDVLNVLPIQQEPGVLVKG